MGATAKPPTIAKVARHMMRQLEETHEKYAWTESGNGFILLVGDPETPSGIIAVDGVRMPEHREQYVNLGLSVVSVIGLALKNALSFNIIKQQKSDLEKALSDLKRSQEELKNLRGIIPICSYCKQIRNDGGAWEQMEKYISTHSDALFSHSICPDCYDKLVEEFEQENAPDTPKKRKSP